MDNITTELIVTSPINIIQNKDINNIHFPVKSPPIKNNSTSNKWNYNSFIYNVNNNNIKKVKITHNQKYIEIYSANNEYHKMILPEGYDYINYLLYKNIDIEIIDDFIQRINIFDIISAIFELLVIRLVFQSINIKQKPSNIKKKKISIDTINSDDKIKAYNNAANILMRILMNDDLDKIHKSDNKIENSLNIAISGKVAEEIVFSALQASTSSVTDFNTIMQIAYNMIGTPYYLDDENEEIRKIIKNSYRKTKIILKRNEKYLHNLATLLLNNNNITYNDILTGISGLSCNINRFRFDKNK